MFIVLIVIVFAFLLGGTPTSYIIVKWRTGKDIRTLGSGNPGATNVFRAVGRKEGVLVLILDALKGILAVVILGGVSHNLDLPLKSFQLIVGLTSVLGHVFSPFLGFKGGKGVATSTGVVLAIYPLITVIAVTVWVICLRIVGYMSVASMVGAFTFAAAGFVLISDPFQKLLTVFAALFIVWTHRSNIKRLVEKSEQKFSINKNKI